MVKPHIESFDTAMVVNLKAAVNNIRQQQVVDQNEGTVMVLAIDKAMIHCDAKNELEENEPNLVFPAECRERGTTYTGSLSVSFKWNIGGETGSSITRKAGNVPIMVKSSFCNLSWRADQWTKQLKQPNEEAQLHVVQPSEAEEAEKEAGGYFIINGQEIVFPMTMKPRRNFPMAIVKQAWMENQNCTKYGIELHCEREDQTASTITLHYLTDGDCELAFDTNQGRCALPVFVVLRALMDLPDKQIKQAIMAGGNTSMSGFIEGMLTNRRLGFSSQTMALEFIGEKFRAMAELPASTSDENVGRLVLKELVFVNLADNFDKFNLLVFMIRKLLDFLRSGRCAVDSADSLKNQEVEFGSHTYLKTLKSTLETYLQKLCFKLEQQTTQNPDRFTVDHIDDAIGRAMSRVPNIDNQMGFEDLGAKVGLALPQATGIPESEEINFYRRLSKFRSVYCTSDPTQKAIGTLGFLCPATPPAPTIYHLTALCSITTKQPNTSNDTLIRALQQKGMMKPASGHPAVNSGLRSLPGNVVSPVSILLDGKVVGTIGPYQAVDMMVEYLRLLKTLRLPQVPPGLEIVYVPSVEGKRGQYPGLYLFTTPGRMVRPVRNLETQCTELIGSFEQADLNIDVDSAGIRVVQGHPTHRELHKGTIPIASVSPFINIGRSNRNLYQRECHVCDKCKLFTPAGVTSAVNVKCSYCHNTNNTITNLTILDVYWRIALDMMNIH